MLTPSIILFCIGILGAFDVAYFHHYKCQLTSRDESRREALIHVARGYVYALQFILVPSVQLNGAWYFALVALFAIDISIAVLDVLEEPHSRKSHGGLSGPEYLMHITLSVLVGAMLFGIGRETFGHWSLETHIGFTELPLAMKIFGVVLALGSAFASTVEAWVLLKNQVARPLPIHVRIRLPASALEVWNVTQDHRLHPDWDHRFSKIVMTHETEHTGFEERPVKTPDPRIQTGTTMRYEKRIGPFLICGQGRYKLHKPIAQSTFEFSSDDARSLIRDGVGLWRYTSCSNGTCEFATSYTYQVRWGVFGQWIDALVFRPLFQKYTEQSFRRLAKKYFNIRKPVVLGRCGKFPLRFAKDTA